MKLIIELFWGPPFPVQAPNVCLWDCCHGYPVLGNCWLSELRQKPLYAIWDKSECIQMPAEITCNNFPCWFLQSMQNGNGLAPTIAANWSDLRLVNAAKGLSAVRRCAQAGERSTIVNAKLSARASQPIAMCAKRTCAQTINCTRTQLHSIKYTGQPGNEATLLPFPKCGLES